MNASYNWLRAFVPFEISPAALRDLITARVATVDDLIPLRTDLATIVVGRVAEAHRHPNSDHLWVTKVDAGGAELLDVVCGAANVEAGKLYPFAPTGTTMQGGLVIERRKIRGEVSNGMLCSARELGLSQEHDGILELTMDAAPGTPILDVLPIGDTRLVIDVLPNRPDLLSHVGVAREIGAALGLPVSLPAIPDFSELRAVSDAPGAVIEVTVESGIDTPRYAGLQLTGVTVGPSPAWLVERVESVGGRSINNVVDATNYVMHELGQPLHAFDATTLANGRIVVRRARTGERLTTLDGVERTLTSEMTVIADGERAQAVAGVMGGRESEVGMRTTELFLESASFDPCRTRVTRRALGLATDASYRFERGVDPELAPFALDRLARVIVAVAGGARVGEPVDIVAAAHEPRTVEVRVARVERLLGVRVGAEEIGTLLGPLNFGVLGSEDLSLLRVSVPSWRPDVTAEVNVIEEIARLRGYDALPDELRPFRPSAGRDAPLWTAAARVRDALVAGGLLEARPMPFVAGAEQGYVRVTNPLAENEAYLRVSVLETLARRAEHNLAHMQRTVRLFEVGAVFAPAAGDRVPFEEMRVGLLVMGDRRPAHFTDPRPPAFDAWDAKALAERAAEAAHPGALIVLEAGDDEGPRTLWRVLADGVVVGRVVSVALDAPVWAAAAFGVEISLGMVDSAQVAPPGEHAYRAPQTGRAMRSVARYRPLATTPASEFDLALLVPESMPAARVEEVLRREGGELLERLALFDEFRGAGLPEGHRSVGWRLTLRHPERTLRDKEIEGRRAKLLKALDAELGVRPRV